MNAIYRQERLRTWGALSKQIILYLSSLSFTNIYSFCYNIFYTKILMSYSECSCTFNEFPLMIYWLYPECCNEQRIQYNENSLLYHKQTQRIVVIKLWSWTNEFNGKFAVKFSMNRTRTSFLKGIQKYGP